MRVVSGVLEWNGSRKALQKTLQRRSRISQSIKTGLDSMLSTPVRTYSLLNPSNDPDNLLARKK